MFRNNAVPTCGIAVTSHTSRTLSEIQRHLRVLPRQSKSKEFSLAERCRQVSRRSVNVCFRNRKTQRAADFSLSARVCVHVLQLAAL